MAHFQKNQSLQSLHSLVFAGRVAYYTEVEQAEELPAVLAEAKRLSLPVMPLGEGSNLLFTTRYEGLLLRPKIRGIHYRSDSRYHYIRVAAGENWHTFVCNCLRDGWLGLENLSLIPGSVGAAPVQNIGAYGVSLSDFLVSVDVYDLSTHSRDTLSASDCRLSYRDSLFKQQPDTYLIYSLQLRLPKNMAAEAAVRRPTS